MKTTGLVAEIIGRILHFWPTLLGRIQPYSVAESCRHKAAFCKRTATVSGLAAAELTA